MWLPIQRFSECHSEFVVKLSTITFPCGASSTTWWAEIWESCFKSSAKITNKIAMAHVVLVFDWEVLVNQQSVTQPINQSIHQSISQSHNQSISLSEIKWRKVNKKMPWRCHPPPPKKKGVGRKKREGKENKDNKNTNQTNKNEQTKSTNQTTNKQTSHLKNAMKRFGNDRSTSVMWS